MYKMGMQEICKLAITILFVKKLNENDEHNQPVLQLQD